MAHCNLINNNLIQIIDGSISINNLENILKKVITIARITPFGISSLSKANRHIAYGNEILCDKETGEISIHTSDKDVMSYNYYARTKANLNLVSTTALYNSFYGSLYAVYIDDIDYPHALTANTIPSALTIEKNSKGFILSLSIDVLTTKENALSKLPIDDAVLSYTSTAIMEDDTTTTINKQVRVNDVSTDLVSFDKPFKSLSLSDITINVVSEDPYVIILNNIILMI